ncbi:hypothetical protein QM290_21625, partial [Stutzerimonas stutzeri]|nr:hypothetical protein [Stutzerimonas stutzeri]
HSLGEALQLYGQDPQPLLKAYGLDAERLAQTVQEADRKIAQPHPLRIHGALPSQWFLICTGMPCPGGAGRRG